jgi:hypothetical protein
MKGSAVNQGEGNNKKIRALLQRNPVRLWPSVLCAGSAGAVTIARDEKEKARDNWWGTAGLNSVSNDLLADFFSV